MIVISIAITAIAIGGTGLFICELHSIVKLHKELMKSEVEYKIERK